MGEWKDHGHIPIDPVKFRALRRKWIMSQPEFAEFLGLDVTTVRDIEGHGSPRKAGVRPRTFRRVLEVTGCSEEDILQTPEGVADLTVIRQDVG